LRVYNYSFACAEGLADLKETRLQIESELLRLKKAENDIDFDARSERLAKFFKDQLASRNQFFDDIHAIQLSTSLFM
jgi:hypothetical protein